MNERYAALLVALAARDRVARCRRRADLEAALNADCPFKVGEVYRSRTGVVATVVGHSVDTLGESVTTWGNVHKKDGKVVIKRIMLLGSDWAGAVKLGTEVAA